MEFNEKYGIPILNGKNYETWCFRVKTALEAREQGIAIQTDGEVGPKVDAAARGIIVATVSDEYLRTIMHLKTAAEMWTELESRLRGKDAARRNMLRTKLDTLRFRDGEDLPAFIREFENVVSDLRSSGGVMDDEEVASKLMRSMPESYEGRTDALEVVNAGKFVFRDVKTSLEQCYWKKEARKLERDSDKKETEGPQAAFMGRVNEQKRNNFRGNYDSNRFTKYRKKCHGCGSTSHLVADCPGKGDRDNAHEYRHYRGRGARGGQNRGRGHWRGRGNGRPNRGDSPSEVNASEVMVVTALKANQVDKVIRGELIALLDSGASHHMCNRKDLFHSYEELDEPVPVNAAEQGEPNLKALGKGCIQIVTENNRLVEVESVLYVPKLRYTLLSLSELDEKKYNVRFIRGKAFVEKNNETYLTAEKIGRLYHTTLKLVNNVEKDDNAEALFSTGKYPHTNESRLEFLHRRYGHLNYRTLKAMIKRGIVKDNVDFDLDNIPLDEYNKCEVCVLAKHHKLPYKKSNYRAQRPLALVHTDVCEVLIEAYDKSNYFVTYIDDYSGFKVVYPIVRKSDVFDTFLLYEKLVASIFDDKYSICTVKCDRGGEYRGQFLKYSGEKGYNVRFTPRKESQLNGVAEVCNKILCEKARAMLIESGLPKCLWSEAVKYAAFVLNRCETRESGKTPAEVALGENTSVHRLKLFGCLAYAHVKEPGDKMSARSRKCFFVGVSEGAYRVYDPLRKRVTVERNVEFDERRTFRMESENKVVKIETSEEKDDAREDEANEKVLERESESEEETRESRPKREKRKPRYLLDYDLNTVTALMAEGEQEVDFEGIAIETNDAPKTYEEAVNSVEKEKWISAMKEEMKAMRENEVWVETSEKERKGEKMIGCKWVYVVKNQGKENERFKARLVAQGFMEGGKMSPEKVYAPVAKISTIRTLLSVAFTKDLKVRQYDVKSAFLHADLPRPIFMKPPPGFSESNSDRILKVKKSLYGLKCAPKCWNLAFHNFISKLGFEQTKSDWCLYIRKEGDGKTSYLCLYVDDIIIASHSDEKINVIGNCLAKQFRMTDEGRPSKFVGISIIYKGNEVMLNQADFINRLLLKFNMYNCNPVSTPAESNFLKALEEDTRGVVNKPYREIIGGLLYLANLTRFDIAYCVNYLSRRVNNPTVACWNAAKRILRYLKGTCNYSIHYTRNLNSKMLVGYADADFGSDPVDRKSFSGYIYEVFGNVVSWSVRKQQGIALSTAEAEYVSLSIAACEGLWLRTLLYEMGFDNSSFEIYEDNVSAIYISSGCGNTKRSKHIDIRFHHIKDLIEKNIVDVKYISSVGQKADLLTKSLSSNRSVELSKSLNLY